MKLKKKSLILIAFLMLIFLSVGYATLQTSIGISGLVNIKGSKVLTFDANGGSVSTSTKRIVPNATYGELPTPERSEYEFLGWYTSETGGEKVTSESIVTNNSNHTLYAHWIRTTLLFDLHGWSDYTIGNGTLSNPDYGSDLDVRIESAGYTINAFCYNTGPTLGHIYFTNNAGVSTDICTITRSESSPKTGEYNIIESGILTISGTASIATSIIESANKVSFKYDGYKITYDFNGGETYLPPYVYTSMIKKGESVTLLKDYVIRDNYYLLGWDTDSNATKPMYSPGQTITFNDNITLYAIWKEIPTLTYSLNSFETHTIKNSEGKISGHEFYSNLIHVNVPKGYTIEYRVLNRYSSIYFTNNSGVKQLNITENQTSVQTGNYTTTEAGVLSMQQGGSFVIKNNDGALVNYELDSNCKTIKFDINGAQGLTGPYSKYIFKPGDSVKLPRSISYDSNGSGIVPPKLLGYSTNKNATTPMYTPEQTITPTENMTLYAIYSADTVL